MDQGKRQFSFVEIFAEPFVLEVLFSIVSSMFSASLSSVLYLHRIQILIIISNLEVAAQERHELVHVKVPVWPVSCLFLIPISKGLTLPIGSRVQLHQATCQTEKPTGFCYQSIFSSSSKDGPSRFKPTSINHLQVLLVRWNCSVVCPEQIISLADVKIRELI